MPSLLMPVSLRLNRQQCMRRRFGRACYAGQSPCPLPKPTFHTLIARCVWSFAAWGVSDYSAVCSTVALHGPRIARVDTSLRFVAIGVICGGLFCHSSSHRNPSAVTAPHHQESFDWLIGRTLTRNLAWATGSLWMVWGLSKHGWKSEHVTQGESKTWKRAKDLLVDLL